MHTKSNINVPFEGISFNAEAVARVPKNDWIDLEVRRYFTSTPEAERRAMLDNIHDLCAKACKEEGVEVVMLPAKPEKGAGKPSRPKPSTKPAPTGTDTTTTQ